MARVPYTLCRNSQHPGPQRHSDYYIGFFLTRQSQWHSDSYMFWFWQAILDNPYGTETITWSDFGKPFLTIPMAQRLPHNLCSDSLHPIVARVQRLLLCLVLAKTFSNNRHGAATFTSSCLGQHCWTIGMAQRTQRSLGLSFLHHSERHSNRALPSLSKL